MDWEKVKRILINLLLVLNLCLFGMNYLANRQYIVTSTEEKAIYEVLASNNVVLYADILKEYSPMRSLNISPLQINISDVGKVFFEPNEVYEIVPEFDKTTIKFGGKSIVVEGNMLTYSNPEGTEMIEDFSATTAKNQADSFIAKMNLNNNASVVMEKINVANNEYTFIYTEQFKGVNVFANSIEITVSEKGVISAEGSYYVLENLASESKEIAACDEVLMTFMIYMKALENEESKYIEKIELGYDFPDSKDVSDGSKLSLVPCYKIHVSEEQEGYLINGYTNEMIIR